MINTITAVEQSELEQHEAVIQRGLNTFVEVGAALLAIRDGNLYRTDYGTFEDYCQQRWGMVSSRARQLIAASEAVSNIRGVTNVTLPVNEAQARPLMSLAPEQQREAWAMAVQTAPDGKVTASHVERVVQEYKTPLAVHFSSRTDDWATPQALFDMLNNEFNFTLDVCASDQNHKCKKYYTEKDDGLTRAWRGICWMNPPYGDVISAWTEKAFQSALEGATVVCLVPARTDTRWWWDFCIHGEVRFLKGRLKFSNAGSAPFPSAVVILNANLPAKKRRVIWWDAWDNVESSV